MMAFHFQFPLNINHMSDGQMHKREVYILESFCSACVHKMDAAHYRLDLSTWHCVTCMSLISGT